MSLFTSKNQPREISVHVSRHRDGYRSVSIHGGSTQDVSELMGQALQHLDGAVSHTTFDGAITVIEARR